VVAGAGSWLIWEASTYAQRRFTEYSTEFLANVEQSGQPIHLQRFSGDWHSLEGDPIPATPQFIEDLHRSIDEMRDVKCCESTDVRSGFIVGTLPDLEAERSWVRLLDDGRLHIGKESVDFLGQLPTLTP